MSFRPCSAYQIKLTRDLQKWSFPFTVTVKCKSDLNKLRFKEFYKLIKLQ